MHPALKLRWSLTDDCHERPGRPRLLKAKADVHHKAMGNIRGPYGMTSKADWDEVSTALGRVFTSVPESAVVNVYNRCHRSLTLAFLHTGSPRGMALMQRRPTGWTERSTGPEFTAVPESMVMNVYSSVPSITDTGVPANL